MELHEKVRMRRATTSRLPMMITRVRGLASTNTNTIVITSMATVTLSCQGRSQTRRKTLTLVLLITGTSAPTICAHLLPCSPPHVHCYPHSSFRGVRYSVSVFLIQFVSRSQHYLLVLLFLYSLECLLVSPLQPLIFLSVVSFCLSAYTCFFFLSHTCLHIDVIIHVCLYVFVCILSFCFSCSLSAKNLTSLAKMVKRSPDCAR